MRLKDVCQFRRLDVFTANLEFTKNCELGWLSSHYLRFSLSCQDISAKYKSIRVVVLLIFHLGFIDKW